MQRLITFTEEEFNNKLLEFVDNFIDQSNKGYGVKLNSNETNCLIHDRETISGFLMIPWNKTFNK